MRSFLGPGLRVKGERPGGLGAMKPRGASRRRTLDVALS
jgi:hypothetical protein